MTTNLNPMMFLHTGGEAISKSDLAYIRTPSATETWCPVPHSTLLDEMYRAFSAHNIQILQEQFAISKEGQRMFGVLEIESETADYSTIVAVRNCHDHSESIKVGLGTRVFVCDNMAFSAEFQMKRKHTAHVLKDLPKQIDGLIAKANDARAKQDAQIANYKAANLSDADANNLLVLMAKAAVFPTTKILEVHKEYHQPRHEEFADKTAWSLMNATTEILKGTSIVALPDRTRRLHSILDHHIGPVADFANTPETFVTIDCNGQLDFADLLAMPVAA